MKSCLWVTLVVLLAEQLLFGSSCSRSSTNTPGSSETPQPLLPASNIPQQQLWNSSFPSKPPLKHKLAAPISHFRLIVHYYPIPYPPPLPVQQTLFSQKKPEYLSSSPKPRVWTWNPQSPVPGHKQIPQDQGCPALSPPGTINDCCCAASRALSSAPPPQPLIKTFR